MTKSCSVYCFTISDFDKDRMQIQTTESEMVKFLYASTVGWVSNWSCDFLRCWSTHVAVIIFLSYPFKLNGFSKANTSFWKSLLTIDVITKWCKVQILSLWWFKIRLPCKLCTVSFGLSRIRDESVCNMWAKVLFCLSSEKLVPCFYWAVKVSSNS